jgi:hypothetical protein
MAQIPMSQVKMFQNKALMSYRKTLRIAAHCRRLALMQVFRSSDYFLQAVQTPISKVSIQFNFPETLASIIHQYQEASTALPYRHVETLQRASD